MKLKAITYSIFISLAFIACNDNISPVGLEIQPDSDKINVRTDTISFTSSTQMIDSIFIKTSETCLGSFDDPVYGNIRYSYLCNFYTAPDGVFGNVIDDRIDSVVLRLLYYGYAGTGFVGDSLTPMEATVREVIKPLGKNFYSNIDPAEYIDENAPAWAKKTYTSRNMNVTDSVYLLGGYRSVDFKLPNTVGEKIYNEWKRSGGKETFAELDSFFVFFPGVYIESTFGSGNILSIDRTYLQIYYQTHIMRNVSGEIDSLVTRYALFDSSEEAIQLNIIDKIENREKEQQLVSVDNGTYLKTPSGVVTQLEISLQDIVNKIGDDRIFNNVKFTLEIEELPAWEYTLSIPKTVLLISPDSIKPFFEEARLADNRYSYYAYLPESSAYRYDFGNISTLIQNSIKKLNEENTPQNQWPPLKLWVIPVTVKAFDGSTSSITTNYFTPSGTKLRKDNLKLYITTTKTNK